MTFRWYCSDIRRMRAVPTNPAGEPSAVVRPKARLLDMVGPPLPGPRRVAVACRANSFIDSKFPVSRSTSISQLVAGGLRWRSGRQDLAILAARDGIEPLLSSSFAKTETRTAGDSLSTRVNAGAVLRATHLPTHLVGRYKLSHRNLGSARPQQKVPARYNNRSRLPISALRRFQDVPTSNHRLGQSELPDTAAAKMASALADSERIGRKQSPGADYPEGSPCLDSPPLDCRSERSNIPFSRGSFFHGLRRNGYRGARVVGETLRRLLHLRLVSVRAGSQGCRRTSAVSPQAYCGRTTDRPYIPMK